MNRLTNQVQIAQANTMSREALFAQQSWSNGLRPDRRQFTQLREVTFDFPTVDRGTCIATLGSTKAMARVTIELVDPSEYRPKHGFLEFTVVRNPSVTDGSSSLGMAARGGDTSKIARTLELLYRNSRALDTESLCVLPGRKVWSLRVEATIMNDAGNSLDAVVWAADGALLNFRRPELTILNDEVIVHPPQERDPVPLALHHIPITITSVLTGTPGSESSKCGAFVVDPSPAEVVGGSGLVSVALSRELELCALQKHDGEDTSYAVIKECIAAGKALVPQLAELMDAAMAEDEERRKQRSMAQFAWAKKRTGVAAAPRDEAANGGGEDETLPEKRKRV